MAPVETVSFDGLREKSFSIVFSYFVCLNSLSDVRKKSVSSRRACRSVVLAKRIWGPDCLTKR